MTNQPPKSLLKRFLDLDLLRILGFIADMTAITSVLTAAQLPNPGTVVSPFLSFWFLLIIWVMALYTYICILHDYWRKTISEFSWCSRFSGFISYNLVVCFSKPWLHIPLLALICSLYAIFYVFTGGFSILAISLVLIIFIPTSAAIFEGTVSFARKESELKKLHSNKFIVDEKWRSIKPLIKKRISTTQWLSGDDIKDILLVKGIDEEFVEYIFSRYAAESLNEIVYGNILKRRENERNIGDIIIFCALINKHNFDYKKYFHL